MFYYLLDNCIFKRKIVFIIGIYLPFLNKAKEVDENLPLALQKFSY